MEKEKYLKSIKNLGAGIHYILPPDCKGDGMDIAVADHNHSLLNDIRAIVKTRGGVVSLISASGANCGYRITIPAQDERIVNCQHPGSWGPWYHLSLYRRTTTGKWRFICELGRSGKGDKNLPFGRPRD